MHPQCGRVRPCAHAQITIVEGRTRLVSTLMVGEGVMRHSGGIPLCILIILECFAQNMKGIASTDLSPLFAATVLNSCNQLMHLLSIEICIVSLAGQSGPRE